MRDIEYPRTPSGDARTDFSENYRWQYELAEKLNHELITLNDNIRMLTDALYGRAAEDELAEQRDPKTKISRIRDMLSTLLDTGDVVDELTSTETKKALSAYQGKLLKDAVDGKVNTRSTIIAANETATLDLGSGFRGVIFVTGVNNNLFEIILAATSSSTTTLRYKQVVSASGLTVTSSGYTITIENTTSNQARLDTLVFTEG